MRSVQGDKHDKFRDSSGCTETGADTYQAGPETTASDAQTVRAGTAQTYTAATAKEMIERRIAATDQEIERLVYELYGLTDKEIRIVEEATE